MMVDTDGRKDGPAGTSPTAPAADRPAAQRTAAPLGPLTLVMRLVEAGPVLMLLLLVAILAIVEPVFLTTRNIGNVLAQTAVISVLAMGQLLVIVTRGVDLSVGAT